MSVGVVIPAYNEEQRLPAVLAELRDHFDEIIVVDDGSSDATGQVAAEAGVRVIAHEGNRGYKEAIVTGLRAGRSDVLVTLDADGEHAAEFARELAGPIVDGRADLVLAMRPQLPRRSESMIAKLVSLAVPTNDASTGFRAVSNTLVGRMKFPGSCLCGSFLLEAASLEARIFQTVVETRSVEKARGRPCRHARQVWTLLPMLWGAKRRSRLIK